ncbi:Flp family type IVb pilin [Faunimonas sp. B44]|uniref:Flp family type IVb pilin n=1 Tax=Faunimonas sp. B44 TaxID=3461493 RepID=UPI004044B886
MLTAKIKRFLHDRSGATAIEYGLIASIVGAALIGIAGTGGALEGLYEDVRKIIDAMVGTG